MNGDHVVITPIGFDRHRVPIVSIELRGLADVPVGLIVAAAYHWLLSLGAVHR